MTSVFIDTAVIMYAAGAGHPLKEPCAAIVRTVATGELPAITSAEVIQEIVHRFVYADQPARAVRMATDALEVFGPVVPVSQSVVERLPALIEKYPGHSARDLVHVATCLEEGISSIVSPDRGFDGVSEIERVDPRDMTLGAR